MYTLTRIELPRKEGVRGRTPCEYRVDGYLVPKELTCCVCQEPKKTVPNQFVESLNKTDMTPEQFALTYTCRSCRKGTQTPVQPVSTPVQPATDPETPVKVSQVHTLKVHKKLRDGTNGVEIGVVINDWPVVFHTAKSQVSLEIYRMASEIYDLKNKICVKHPNKDVTNIEKNDTITKFSHIDFSFGMENAQQVVEAFVKSEI